MVKKNLLNLVALVLGFGFVIVNSAFKAHESRTQYAFHYQGPEEMEIGDVTDEANWVYDATPISCTPGTDEACSILIDGAYVNNPLTAPQLSSSAALTAELSDKGTARVTGSADALITKNNRQQ